MTSLSALWLPILVSSAVVFIASSIIHMALPWHSGDYRKVPNEDSVQDALRPAAIPPGDYMIPRASSMKDMGSPAFLDKLNRGPVLIATVLPNGRGSMAQSLILWFVFSAIVGLFAGYVAAAALPPGTAYLSVFRFVGTVAFVGYSMALWEMSIWYRRSWATTLKSTIDGLIYGLLTAGVFGWLWPR